MSENLGISKFSLMEETGCGTGAVAPAARNSRKRLRFFREISSANFREFREILVEILVQLATNRNIRNARTFFRKLCI